ncbi:MAG: Crp/Fnr family transcriptional regulator [Cyanobacteria bacterium P01_E01_bin.42]
MDAPPSALNPPRSLLKWQETIVWAKQHYRDRAFNKDESIPVRPGLLYWVQCGAVLLTGNAKGMECSPHSHAEESAETFVGLIGAGYPFEIPDRSRIHFQASARVDSTTVIWMYWHDLDNWPHFRSDVLDLFRDRYQRQLLLLTTLGQRRALDRLWGFLVLLMEEYGQIVEGGVRFPYPLTHAQIGSAIGSTRVTVTRLIGRLRQQGLISIEEDNTICLLNSEDGSLGLQKPTSLV